MLLFDSDSLPLRERHGAVVDSLTSAAAASIMIPDRGGGGMHLRLHGWELGGVEVIDARCSAHTLRRTPRQTSRDDETVLAITYAMRGRGVHRQLDHELTVRPSALWATNFAIPYEHHVTDTWTTTAKIPLRLLGVAHDQVGDGLSVAAAASLGTATLALARAVFLSVTADGMDHEAHHDTLMLRAKKYISDHLAEAGLSASAIAEANHVSVRQLYRTWTQADLPLEQWIIAQRLERAREELARPAATPVSITAVAQRWGFASASHFTRRFRDAYDLSPREWQVINHEAPAHEKAQAAV